MPCPYLIRPWSLSVWLSAECVQSSADHKAGITETSGWMLSRNTGAVNLKAQRLSENGIDFTMQFLLGHLPAHKIGMIN